MYELLHTDRRMLEGKGAHALAGAGRYPSAARLENAPTGLLIAIR